MTATTLFVWAVLAASPHLSHPNWIKLETFDTPALCAQAQKDLGLTNGKSRCITKGAVR